MEKVADIFTLNSLENEIKALPFDSVEYYSHLISITCQGAGWASEGFPIITESAVTDNFKTRSDYTKSFRTGVKDLHMQPFVQLKQWSDYCVYQGQVLTYCA